MQKFNFHNRRCNIFFRKSIIYKRVCSFGSFVVDFGNVVGEFTVGSLGFIVGIINSVSKFNKFAIGILHSYRGVYSFGIGMRNFFLGFYYSGFKIDNFETGINIF